MTLHYKTIMLMLRASRRRIIASGTTIRKSYSAVTTPFDLIDYCVGGFWQNYQHITQRRSGSHTILNRRREL